MWFYIAKWVKNSWELIFLGILTFFTRFFNLSWPAKVVFDEAHFGLYASKYLSHQYFFDIHPPLGKMFLALAGWLGKINSQFNWLPGADYPEDFNFIFLRFLPAFFGSLLVILVYLLVKEMGFSRRIAFLASFLVLFDNTLIVQSRFILLDIILLFFIILSLYFFILSKKFSFPSDKWYLINFLCGLTLAAAISIKWTGFGVLGVIWLFTILGKHFFSKQRKEIILKIVLIFILPLLIYFLIFVLHFNLLSINCQSNCDALIDQSATAVSSQSFFSDFLKIVGSYPNDIPSGNLLDKFIKINKVAFLTAGGEGTFYYYQSDWWTWPLMIRPVLYFSEIQDSKTSHIYLFGNPLVYWLGFFAVLGFFYVIIKNYFYKFKLKIPLIFYSENLLILVSSYLIYLITFAAVPRYLLLYTYLPALTFSIIIFAVFFEGVIGHFIGPVNQDRILFQNKKANLILLIILAAVFISFLYFSPLTYGFPLTNEQFQLRMWLDTWSF